MSGELAPNRTILRLSGVDARTFLSGLVTRDPGRDGALTYSALLTPQGKYLADFFLLGQEDGAVLIDVASDIAAGLRQRLAMYRLRADVEIAEVTIPVSRGLGPAPQGAHPDPRNAALGWRAYDGPATGPAQIDWDAIRVAHCIPETGIELIPNDTYILEARFDALSGVDHRKGCYVGQEVTARMKHKTELKKGFVTVAIDGPADPGTEITTGDKPVGRLFTRAGAQAIAYLRFDRAGGAMQAGAARVTWTDAAG